MSRQRLPTALLTGNCESKGAPIPTHDMGMAALILEHSLVLFARDAHFDALPSFRVSSKSVELLD